MRSADGSGSLMEFRSRSGERRGNHGQITANKTFIINNLRKLGGSRCRSEIGGRYVPVRDSRGTATTAARPRHDQQHSGDDDGGAAEGPERQRLAREQAPQDERDDWVHVGVGGRLRRSRRLQQSQVGAVGDRSERRDVDPRPKAAGDTGDQSSPTNSPDTADIAISAAPPPRHLHAR